MCNMYVCSIVYYVCNTQKRYISDFALLYPDCAVSIMLKPYWYPATSILLCYTSTAPTHWFLMVKIISAEKGNCTVL